MKECAPILACGMHHCFRIWHAGLSENRMHSLLVHASSFKGEKHPMGLLLFSLFCCIYFLYESCRYFCCIASPHLSHACLFLQFLAAISSHIDSLLTWKSKWRFVTIQVQFNKIDPLLIIRLEEYCRVIGVLIHMK